MYGYELVQAIRTKSKEKFEFGEGCIYPILHRLKALGLLQSRREKVGGRSRVVYRLTTKGHRQLADSTRSWKSIVEAVSQVLGERRNERVALA